MVTDAPALAGRDHAWTKHDGTPPESPADPDRPEEAPRDDRPPAPRGAGPDRGPNTRTSTGRSTAARNRRSGRAALAVWAVSRLLTLALLHWAPAGPTAAADRLPESWNTLLGAGLLVGPLPGGDPGGLYPPGAALVLAVPGLLPAAGPGAVLAAAALVCDALVLLVLLRAGIRREEGSMAGAWLWVLALPLLLGLPYARPGLLVVALTVPALLLLAARPRLGGALAGLAATVAAWPLLLLLGSSRGRGTRRACRAAAVSVLAAVLPAALLFGGATAVLPARGTARVWADSPGGSLLALARAVGWPVSVERLPGSAVFTGPYASAVAACSLLLAGAGLGWLLLWRLCAPQWTAATPYDAALAAVLLFTVTGRGVGPEHLVWLIGLAAVCLTAARTTQRPVVVLLLLAVTATTADHPLLLGAVPDGSWQGTAVAALRNLLLLAAALLSCVRLWRGTVRDGLPPERAPRGVPG